MIEPRCEQVLSEPRPGEALPGAAVYVILSGEVQIKAKKGPPVVLADGEGFCTSAASNTLASADVPVALAARVSRGPCSLMRFELLAEDVKRYNAIEEERKHAEKVPSSRFEFEAQPSA